MVLPAHNKIPLSVIVVTRNEENRIAACIKALSDFSDVIVVDSSSADRTQEIAAQAGARVIDFKWNGQYPKKRQWCLNNVAPLHDWVFFVDADEILTKELIEEIRALDFRAAGYFVKGRYILNGRALRFGLHNNKLALINRRKIEFPVVDDLNAPGMGEIEGHYQPVLKKKFCGEKLEQLKNALLHDAVDDVSAWHERHQRYAAWEREMDARKAWPSDVTGMRKILKKFFKALPFRPLAAFLHCYILKAGFLDGARGFKFARSRWHYYRMI